jgi:glycosyltransferase involved in cell wall biosynthesis
MVVPCYNEGARLKIGSFLEFALSHASIQFLFVNDGSTDNTLAVLDTLCSQYPERMKILDQQPNAGKAEAVRMGMLTAMRIGEPAYVGFWDADLATPLETIPEFAELLENNLHLQMVFGARIRLLGRQVHRRAIRHYLGRCFASAVSIALHLPIYDTQCGAKLFRSTPELELVLRDPFLSRWIFDVEILARYIALHDGNIAYMCDAIYELPLKQWEDVAGSKVHAGDFFQASFDILRIYRKYIAPLR